MVLILVILQITGGGFLNYNLPEILGTGGPDAYGYQWIDSDTTGGPTYNWIDISGIGTEIIGLGDDNVVGPVPIGFDFSYYWYTVNSFYVGSNGYIAFGDNTLEAAPFPQIPNTARPNNFLAPFMSDLNFSAGSPGCYYWTNAAQDTFIIAYNNVQFWGVGSSLNTFEIILTKADSAITFQYHTQQGVPYGGWSDGLSVGIENIAGNIGLQYNHDQQPSVNAIHSDLAVYFYPPDSTTYEAHDISVVKIMNDISGGFFVYNDDPVDFWGVIKNTGNQTESGFDVYCEIKNASSQVVFSDTIAITSINPNEIDSLVFSPTWSTTTDGLYSMKVQSLLTDMVPENDSIFVEFRVITYPAELLYDIGYSHTGMAWNGPNSGYGAKFVPPKYPVKINTARFNINSTTSSPNVTVQIMDDDGSNGDPGTILYETVVLVTAPIWYDIDVSSQNILITSGGFYVGCISNQASDPYFGMDTLFPSGRQTWEYTGVWAPYRDKETDDVLIHAVVELGTGVEETELVTTDDIMNITASPNPFSKVTAVTVAPSCKKMAIYDASGRLVRNLEVKDRIASWDGCSNVGKQMSQGIYFAISDSDQIIKLVFVK